MAIGAGVVAEGKRYSPFDPDEVHADMRIDPVTTRRNMARSPGVVDKHRGCQECAALTPPARPDLSRRVQVRFTAGELADVLGLPTNQRIVRMFVDPEPHVLLLVVEGPEFDEVPDTDEAPIAQLRL